MSRKSWHGQIRMSVKEPPLLLHFRTAYGSRETLIKLQSQILLSVSLKIFPLLFIMKKCYIIGRNSNFLAINWS